MRPRLRARLRIYPALRIFDGTSNTEVSPRDGYEKPFADLRTDESSIAGCVGGATARGIGLARFALLHLLFAAVALAFAVPTFAQTPATDNFNRPDGGLGRELDD